MIYELLFLFLLACLLLFFIFIISRRCRNALRQFFFNHVDHPHVQVDLFEPLQLDNSTLMRTMDSTEVDEFGTPYLFYSVYPSEWSMSYDEWKLQHMQAQPCIGKTRSAPISTYREYRETQLQKENKGKTEDEN